MKLLAMYIGSVLSVFWGTGISLLRPTPEQVVSFDMASLCEARGGAWVHGSVFPLCMTPEEGLLQFVDGTFVAFQGFETTEEALAAEEGKISEEIDPWEEGYRAPLAQQDIAVSDTCAEREVEKYLGRVARVDFSTWPDASKYRTAITKDVSRGVNFAGSYIVSTWGCGSRRDACVGHAILDARNGAIVLYGIQGKRAGEFSIDANQLVITTTDGEKRKWSIEGDELISCL
ncbi:hypothetical protein EBT31_07380 [bacterium]|nr:hypothetical protein [bacterium]NBX49291.1 hypothetical protein [bacterium]